LKLRGSTLVTKRRERSEAKGPSGKPRCPQWLDADAKAVWRQLVPQLQTMGVFTRVDSNPLARYCRLWSRWRKAEAFLDQHGEVYPLKDEGGRVKYLQQWPQVAIAGKLAHLLTRLEQEFGMTPSARTRIQVDPQPAEDSSGKSRFFGVG
jgi:P27 family predicted phage terminase small subunit